MSCSSTFKFPKWEDFLDTDTDNSASTASSWPTTPHVDVYFNLYPSAPSSSTSSATEVDSSGGRYLDEIRKNLRKSRSLPTIRSNHLKRLTPKSGNTRSRSFTKKPSTHSSGISLVTTTLRVDQQGWDAYRRTISEPFQPLTGFIYRKGHFWDWFKTKPFAHCIAFHILVTLTIFGCIECKEYILTGSPEVAVFILACILALVTIVLLYITVFMDPGAMPIIDPDLQELSVKCFFQIKDNFESLDRVVLDVSYGAKVVKEDFCPDCMHFKPIKTIHCYNCEHCIARFDHHCLALGCCIGLRNFKFFYFYQWSIIAYYVLVFVFSVYRFHIGGTDHGFAFIIILMTYFPCFLHSSINILITPLVYAYLISKGKTAYEAYYFWSFRKLRFQKVSESVVYNELVERYCPRKSCKKNWRDFVFQKTPKSCIDATIEFSVYDAELPIVFDYESGDTESREFDSEDEEETTDPWEIPDPEASRTNLPKPHTRLTRIVKICQLIWCCCKNIVRKRLKRKVAADTQYWDQFRYSGTGTGSSDPNIIHAPSLH